MSRQSYNRIAISCRMQLQLRSRASLKRCRSTVILYLTGWPAVQHQTSVYTKTASKNLPTRSYYSLPLV